MEQLGRQGGVSSHLHKIILSAPCFHISGCKFFYNILPCTTASAKIYAILSLYNNNRHDDSNDKCVWGTLINKKTDYKK